MTSRLMICVNLKRLKSLSRKKKRGPMLTMIFHHSTANMSTLPNEGHGSLWAPREAAPMDPFGQGSWVQDIPIMVPHREPDALQPRASASAAASKEAGTGMELAQGGDRVGVANPALRDRHRGAFTFVMSPMVSDSSIPNWKIK